MRFPMVLLYHIVLPPPSNADQEERKLFVHPERFMSQMEDLHRRGCRTLSLNEFRAAIASGSLSPSRFLLTFDDAYAHVNGAVTPTLHRLGFSAVMFAPWGHLGGRNVWDRAHRNLAHLDIATAAELKAMDGAGWEVASHGLRHTDLSTLDPADRFGELRAACERFSNLLGRSVIDFAYPYGVADEGVSNDVSKAGYRTGFLARPSGGANLLQIPRQPIRGDEGMAIVRLRTSSLSNLSYRLGGLAPRWAKTATRAILH